MLIIRRLNCINTSSGMISVIWCLVCRSGGYCSSLLTGIPSSHLHRLIIPDVVLIQFDLLMISDVMLETCREMKWTNTWKSASSWLFPKICEEMHDQKNIKNSGSVIHVTHWGILVSRWGWLTGDSFLAWLPLAPQREYSNDNCK